MFYLTQYQEIIKAIEHLSSYSILWLDTEIAHWNTPNPQLSLIQALADPNDLTGKNAYVLDILQQPKLADYFIQKIMVNENIEKNFYNADFDLRYLGGKEITKNVTCSYKIAQQIGKKKLNTTNLKLKTLAVELCNFPKAKLENEQGSNWGKRPLTSQQLQYAKMDVVYLADVYKKLLSINGFQNRIKLDDKYDIPSIKLSYECPRLLYLKVNDDLETTWLKDEKSRELHDYLIQLELNFLMKFHTHEDLQNIFTPQNLDINEVSHNIQNTLYKLSFYPFLIQAHQTKFLILEKTWRILSQIIKLWSAALIKNSRYYDYENLIKNTFLISDYFDHVIIYDQETGSLTFLDLDFNRSLEKIADLAKIALIVHHNLAKNLVINSVNYITFPSENMIKFTWEEIEELLNKISQEQIPQISQWMRGEKSLIPTPTQDGFCLVCPQETQCKKVFVGVKTVVNSDEIAQQLVKVLNSFGIEVICLGSIIAPSFIRIKLKPKMGVKVISIINKSNDLMVQLGLEYPPLIEPQSGFISVDIPRQEREIAYFNNYFSKQEKGNITDSLKIAIGVNLEGNLVEADLTDSNTCHFLIAGTTGSGKSEFLRSLLLSLLRRYSEEDLKVVLVDPKRVTFPEFDNISWLHHPIIKDEELAINLMEELVQEMENRYKILEQNKCNNIKVYNQKNSSSKIPHLVCIFDEYADLMVEKSTAQLLEASIKRLGAKARAAGIHLIIATQRPEARVITPLIRSNLPGRVSLLTKAASESEMMLGAGKKMATQLLGKGDLLFLNGAVIERLQSLFVHNFNL